MGDKIIGFTVSQSKIDHEDVDIFKRGLSIQEMEIHGFYVYIWGINQIKNCTVDGKYSLAFPLSDNLLDRNVLIYPDDNGIIIENDWLGSIPVFYNEKEVIVSTLSLKALVDTSIHPEGLANYVEFGYSVFEQTPFKNVKFMRYYSKIVINQGGIKIQYKDDPALDDCLYREKTDEAKVFNRIKKYVSSVEAMTKEEIIIPTSGGYDSRLLNICINEKSRIQSYTYGISKNQSKSIEVVHAKKVSEILGTQWNQIELGKYNQYIEEWFKIYGISTHLHGMYHIEFYNKIIQKKKFSSNATFLSGIVGDAWAGSIKVSKIQNIEDLTKLGYSHGLHADKEKLKLRHDSYLREKLFHENKENFNNDKIWVIFLIRFKIILLSYLTIIPEYFGFPVWTPYLNFNIAVDMLNLPEERRDNRVWQRDIFHKYNLDIENMDLKSDRSNTQDYQAYLSHEFNPLDIKILSPYFKKDYLKNINKVIMSKPTIYESSIDKFINKITQNRYIKYGLNRIGVKNKNIILVAAPYYVLKPLEMGLSYQIDA